MRLNRPTLFNTFFAVFAALSLACSVQEPAVVDPLDPPDSPDPSIDTLLVTPQDIATAVDVPVTFVVPDTSVLGTPIDGAATWSASGGNIDASGVFVSGAAGTFTVHALRAGREGHARVVVSAAPVPPPPPATLSGVELTPTALRMMPGSSQQFTAIGRLTNGQPVTIRVTWSAAGGTVSSSGLYTAGSSAGTFRVIATREGDTPADTSLVTVTSAPATLTGIRVSPGAISIAPAGTQQFSAVGMNSDGSNSSVQVNWSATGGTITTGGRYTAGSTPGSYRVIAVRLGDTKADTSVVTITAPPPTLAAVEVTPASVKLSAGASQQFTALGRMSDGSAASIMVTWSGTGGTVSSGGRYTAGAAAGTFRVIAVRQGDTKADTSTVTVTASLGSTPQPPTLSSVVLTPTTVSLAAGATQQFTAQGKMSDGSTSIVSVTYAANGGTVSTSGLYKAGATAGGYRIIAAQQGGTKADTSTITVTAGATSPPPPPPASNGTADPSVLPSVTSQVKDVAAYTALNVRAMASGGSYLDPVTGVRVWKVTSATVPMNNPGSGHDYSEGPVQVSREWGGNKHTLLVRVDYGGYWLVDLTRGSGLSNWRQLSVGPRTTSAASFSQNPSTPQILFVMTTGGLVRVNTATNSVANTGNFPATIPMLGWLTQDKQDGWFVGQGTSSGTVVAWNSQTNETRTKSFNGLDEPYFERDGRYVFANVGSRSSTIWDLQTNTTYPISAPSQATFFHMPGLRGFFMTTDVGTGNGETPLWRIDPSTAKQNAEVSTLSGYSPDAHAAGQWVQEDAQLPGGDRTKQWFLRSTFNMSYTATGNGAKEALAFIRADGSDFRLLAHHYSIFSGSLPADPFKYWSMPRATPSPDGKVVLFDSNMLAGAPARYDLFVAEVPLR